MYSLLTHNKFGIDAKCTDFISYQTVEQLKSITSSLKGKRWLQIGGGSNLLFVHDFEGVVLHSEIKDIEIVRRNGEYVWLRVGAGYVWDDFVAYCVAHGYYGLENLSLIPGEVGASVVQNIGAYGVDVGQYIDTVEAVEVATGNVYQFKGEECRYAYRSSVFKHEMKGKYIVTHVIYRLSLSFAPDLSYGAISRALQANDINAEVVTAQVLRNVIIDVRRSKLPDPAEIGSAGSFFMNPVVSQSKFESLQQQYPDMPHYVVDEGVKIPAGWMIEQCGWKGKRVGNVGVYSKQALVLVNYGGAKGEDIVQLSNAVIADVERKFGITLHPEVNFIE